MVRPAVAAVLHRRLKCRREIARRVRIIEPGDKHPFAAVKVADPDKGADAFARDPKIDALPTIAPHGVSVLTLDAGAVPSCGHCQDIGERFPVGLAAGGKRVEHFRAFVFVQCIPTNFIVESSFKRARFKRDAQKLIDAGELNPIDAEAAVNALVRRQARHETSPATDHD